VDFRFHWHLLLTSGNFLTLTESEDDFDANVLWSNSLTVLAQNLAGCRFGTLEVASK